MSVNKIDKNSTNFEKIYEVVSIKQVISVRDDIPNYVVKSPVDIVKVIQNEIAHDDREVFLVIALGINNKIVSIHRSHVGTINQSIIHPREVFKSAILNNAARIIVAHQHPSGNTKPSKEDIQVTRILDRSGRILGIDLLDHLIVSPSGYTSIKQEKF